MYPGFNIKDLWQLLNSLHAYLLDLNHEEND